MSPPWRSNTADRASVRIHQCHRATGTSDRYSPRPIMICDVTLFDHYMQKVDSESASVKQLSARRHTDHTGPIGRYLDANRGGPSP